MNSKNAFSMAIVGTITAIFIISAGAGALWAVYGPKLLADTQKTIQKDNTDTNTKPENSENTIKQNPKTQDDTFTKKGHSEGAIYRYGVWYEPGTAGYYYELGFDEWINKGDWQAAKKYYLKALEVDPNYPPALSSYGSIQGSFENNFEDGIKNIKKAMELDPTWAYAPFNLAILYDLKGDWEEAQKWMKYTEEHFSSHPDFGHFESMFRNMREYHSADDNK